MTLSTIEAKYGFTYPELYKHLQKDGMLDVGEYGPDWYRMVFPKLKDNPPLLLYTFDFELLNEKAVAGALADLADPDDYRQIRPEFKFIPFAQSGAGDHYCFFPTGQEGDDIPIVFLWHDSNTATYLAKNLQDYIFRTILTDMSEKESDESDEAFRSTLKSVLKTHSRYLPQEQVEILEHTLSKDIVEYEIALPRGRKETYSGFLTNIERTKILEAVVPYLKMGQSFEYS